MIKKSIVLAALMSALPLCAGVKLETTLKLADQEVVKELEFDVEKPATMVHEGIEYSFGVEDAQEDSVTLNVVVSDVDGVEHASRKVTAEWDKATEVTCEGSDITLTVVPSRIA